MNLAGTTFRAVSNSKNGSLNSETEMRFTSDEGLVIGTYSGGTIVAGQVLGKRLSESTMEMLYHGATINGEVQAGRAQARFAKDADDQLRMYLDWHWLTGDQSQGQSEWLLVSCAPVQLRPPVNKSLDLSGGERFGTSLMRSRG